MTRCAAALTSVGAVRDHNEDCAAVSGHILNESHLSTFTIDLDGNLLIVADGMGGHAKGEVASTLTIQGLNRLASSMIDVNSCIDAIRKVNRELYDAMSRDEALRGMGTTVAGVVLQQTSVLWFNVGDSRAYLYRGHLKQLTKDHVPQGDTAPTSHRSHAITQSLGGHHSLIEVWPAAGQISITRGDKILLCSDGLTDLLSDDEIERHMHEGDAPKQMACNLVNTVLTRGAPDNVTVIVASL
jgi:serine/threonine protein phosphatase PrpC